MSKIVSKLFINEKTKSNKASHSKESELNETEIKMSLEIKRTTNYLEKRLKNKEIKEYIPIAMRKKKEKSEENTKWELNKNAKEYVPTKNKLKKKEKKEVKEEPKIYSYEFLMKFETMEISNKTDLLNEEVLEHINSLNIVVKHEEKWSRKDYTKEEKTAEDNKKKFEANDNKDSDIKELREIMNTMTKDNYDEKKEIILKKIKDDEKLQEQFIKKILFKKAVMEMPYAELYSELSKFLNKKLPQKSKKSEKSSLFREILIDECKKVLKAKNFDEYINEEDQREKEIKIKKFYKGNMNLILQLVKVKMQSKKIIVDCFEFLIKKFQNEKDSSFKIMIVETILHLVNTFGTYINTENEKLKVEDAKKYKEKVDEFIEELEEIKDDESLPGHIKYKIINLIEKKKNNYKESKFEKSLRIYSKEELKKESIKEDDKTEMDTAEADEEAKEKEQEEINEKIKSDLSEYKDCIEEDGNSKNFTWKTTTILYDVEFKSIEDITEGYLVASADFIENEDNIQYAKDYIKELFSFYNEKMEMKEKDDLQKRVFSLYELVKDFAYETPKIYDIYAYLFFVFMENDIMEIEDFKKIFIGRKKDDIKKLSMICKNVHDYNKSDEFKKELKAVPFVCKNKREFEWVF